MGQSSRLYLNTTDQEEKHNDPHSIRSWKQVNPIAGITTAAVPSAKIWTEGDRDFVC